MSPLRWGLVGASDIAATRVIPALRRLGNDVVGVASSSQDRARTFARENGLRWSTTNLEALLSRDGVDVVYISTTNEMHCTQTLKAAAAGKHVFCEKPLALSLEDASRMIDACEAADVVLGVNHHLPAAGTHRAIRKLVANGAVGTPLAVRVFHAVCLPDRLRRWRLMSPERGGGVILDITIHDIAAIDSILGVHPVEAAALAVRQGCWSATAEDAVVTALRYEGDVLVQTHDAFTVAYAGTGLEVHGTDGSIAATDVMTQDPDGRVVLRTERGERKIAVDRRDLYDTALEAFSAAVVGDGRPVCDGADGAHAVAGALAVKEAAETGCAVAVTRISGLKVVPTSGAAGA